MTHNGGKHSKRGTKNESTESVMHTCSEPNLTTISTGHSISSPTKSYCRYYVIYLSKNWLVCLEVRFGKKWLFIKSDYVVNKRLHRLCEEDELWKRHYKRLGGTELKSPSKTYKMAVADLLAPNRTINKKRGWCFFGGTQNIREICQYFQYFGFIL